MEKSRDMILKVYRNAVAIRAFELAAHEQYANGLLAGSVHLYVGEEGIASGVCGVLKEDDYITSTHRGHGHLIAKGGDLKRMMAEPRFQRQRRGRPAHRGGSRICLQKPRKGPGMRLLLRGRRFQPGDLP